MDRDYVLHKLIPHRLEAVSALTVALRYCLRWSDPKPMEIYFDGKLSIEGNSNGFTNPTIDAGVIHCRALLEFVGLCARHGSLKGINLPRKSDDVGIEHFSNSNGPLALVTPQLAVSRYSGDVADAESALLAIFHAANKGLAHITSAFDTARADAHLIEIASRGVPALVISHLYTPLGLPAPEFEITHRPRNGR